MFEDIALGIFLLLMFSISGITFQFATPETQKNLIVISASLNLLAILIIAIYLIKGK
jgi:hypothetical protein